jgi:hypothetical protein
MLTARSFVRLVGVIGVVVCAIAVWAEIDRQRAGLAKPITIELARSTSDVCEILTPAANVAKMQHQIWIDNRFIVSYWLLFLGAAVLFRWATPTNAGWNIGLTSVAATAAAIFDFQENSGIRRSLKAYPQLSLEVVRDTREASLLKWLLTFIVVLMLAQLFARRSDPWRWVGIIMAAGGLIGIGGLAWGAQQQLISAGFLLALAALLAAVVQWLFRPDVFLTVR